MGVLSGMPDKMPEQTLQYCTFSGTGVPELRTAFVPI